jgi:hypothetical protein
MLATLGTGLDQRLTRLIIHRLRRRWPLLRFVPAALLAPLVAPAAVHVRRSLLRGATATALLAVLAGLALVAVV